MDTLELSKKTVKVISQNNNYDWIHPHKNKSDTQEVPPFIFRRFLNFTHFTHSLLKKRGYYK